MNKETIKYKNGILRWDDFELKSIVTQAKYNLVNSIITIDTKESSDFPGYSIILRSDNEFEFKGKYESIESVNFEIEKGNLYFKLYKNGDNHVLLGKWLENGEGIVCIIELSK